MQKVPQAWLIVTLTGTTSAFFLGLDSFLGEAPILLFTLIGGVVADRRDRRHMMLVSQFVQMRRRSRWRLWSSPIACTSRSSSRSRS